MTYAMIEMARECFMIYSTVTLVLAFIVYPLARREPQENEAAKFLFWSLIVSVGASALSMPAPFLYILVGNVLSLIVFVAMMAVLMVTVSIATKATGD